MNSRWKCSNSIVIKHHLRPLVISFELALHVMTVWIYNCQWHLSFSTTNASVLWFGTHACNDISFADGRSGRHQKHVIFMQPLIDFEQRKWISLLAMIWGLHFRGKGKKSVSCGLDLQRGIVSETSNFLDIYCLLKSPPPVHNADSDDATILYMLWTTQNNFTTYFSSLLCRSE